MPDNSSLSEYFTKIFRENRWGNDESASGAGSSLGSSTVKESILALDDVIRKFGIRSIADIPCGDFYWMPLVLGRFPRIEYNGYDIVEDLINLNRQRYPDYDFNILDVTSTIVPQADLIFCKDLLFHLSNRDIALACRNFKASGSRYLLVSNINCPNNIELAVDDWGAYRDVNLFASPYNFPSAIWSTNYLALWSLDSIGTEFLNDLVERV